MKKIFFHIIILVGIGSQGYAQSFCATPATAPDLLQRVPASRMAVASNNYVLRIFVHVMRRSNGTGGQTQAAVTQGLNYVVADFGAQGICVSLLGSDEIWNDSYYNMNFPDNNKNGDGKFDNFSPNSHSNAIDLYLFGTDGNIIGGKSAGIPGTAVTLGGLFSDGTNLVASHVLSHELGHCMGLFHTFHGLCEPGCPELVNGSNCTTCGDFVCDTPPDPQVWAYNPNCSWNGSTCSGSTVDANGNPYNPAMNLIMAYIPPGCMQLFTNGQGTRMRSIIANSSLLQGVTVPNTLTVSNVTINTGVTTLYDVLNNLTTQNVTINSGGRLTLRAGQEIDLTAPFDCVNGSFFDGYIDNGCSTIDQANSAKKAVTQTLSSNAGAIINDAASAHIYPNPVSGIVNISISVNAAGFIQVKAISASGVVLKTKKYPVTTKGMQQIQLDVSDLAHGIYVIQISDGAKVINKKVIKLN